MGSPPTLPLYLSCREWMGASDQATRGGGAGRGSSSPWLGGRYLKRRGFPPLNTASNIAGVLPQPFLSATFASAADAKLRRPRRSQNAPVTPKNQTHRHNRRHFAPRTGAEELRLAYHPRSTARPGAGGIRGTGPLASIRSRCGHAGRFIPLAEQCGLIDDLTAQVIDQGLRWLAECRAAPACSLSLNLSARNLADLHLADRIAAQCQQFSIEPGRLILEITESCAAESSANALDLLTPSG